MIEYLGVRIVKMTSVDNEIGLALAEALRDNTSLQTFSLASDGREKRLQTQLTKRIKSYLEASLDVAHKYGPGNSAPRAWSGEVTDGSFHGRMSIARVPRKDAPGHRASIMIDFQDTNG